MQRCLIAAAWSLWMTPCRVYPITTKASCFRWTEPSPWAAAEARGWPIHWYDAKKVLDLASHALHVKNLDAFFLELRRAIGPPWNRDHKLAMAAAIVTARAISE